MKNTQGLSFVTVMVIIAVSAIFLRFGIEQIIKFNIEQNESVALATLKIISAALENYAKDNHGVFPTDISVLIKTSPQYLDRDYILESPIKGYYYSCSRLEPSTYSCSAVPAECKLTGKKIYSIATGGSLASEEECSKKE